MKQIIMSAGVIVFVAALVAGGTGAFFSDSETSTGNVFTAGAIDLTVDSQQHYNNVVCVNGTWQLEPGETADSPQYPVIGSACDGTWSATNLGAQTFFNFADVKPGDEGENTISLHVDSNDAYACVDVSLTANDDVSTTDPETDAGDVPNTGSLFDGELAQNINFFAWSDFGATLGFQGTTDPGEGDNIWQANEPALFSNGVGPASDVLDGESYTLADSTVGPLAGGSTSYIGLAWCAGALDASIPGTLTCNGGAMGNVAQTDSLVANIAFRIEQARNNPNFTCGDIPPSNTDVQVRQSDLAQDAAGILANPTSWFFYNDASDTVMTTNQFTGTAGANEIVTGPVSTDAAYMKLGTETDPRYNIATYQFKDVKLSTLSSLGYRVYDATADSDTPFLNFNIDFNNSDTWQKRLVYVPTGLPTGTWTNVDAIQGGTALWTYSGAFWPAGGSETGTTPGTTAKTWSSIVADYPNAETRSTDSWLGVRVGQPGPAAAEGYVDWVEFNGTKYDFKN